MTDAEFDRLASIALSTEEPLSEKLWARSRPAAPRWTPSLYEIGFAFAVGCGVLIGLVRLSQPPAPERYAEVKYVQPPIEDTFDDVTRLSGDPPGLVSKPVRFVAR